MIRISYSSPDNIELAGGRSDFAALWADLKTFLPTSAKAFQISADHNFDPSPYESRLNAIEFVRQNGPNIISIDGDVLRISGSTDNLALFGSWLDFEDTEAPQHSHYEFHEGSQWVAPDSLPLVISLQLECAEH